ncbi:hypothetical protein CAMRE0001_1657 [Campylobacter rectus RM3267]|uniref:Uncharacterized protein n=1 Tax=Campylobacter rectus RM3267 TaxID=553218 RepID=B9CZ78_CAMRE|nr:hypothetical protein CAMRE0001_1657 [Campylobacter rectus RM3267]
MGQDALFCVSDSLYVIFLYSYKFKKMPIYRKFKDKLKNK